MTIKIITERMKTYTPRSIQEEEHVIKEIYQEIALSGLARAGFFKLAAFQGDTCLRILHQLNRFSEDLDFQLIHPDRSFSWQPYLTAVRDEFDIYGVQLTIKDAPEERSPIQKAFLKHDSFAKVFELAYERDKSHRQTITIKFEVDTHPPGASLFESHQLDFPLPFAVVTQDKPSLFASKCHALLCRKFLKGRDWYDYLWYVANKIQVNLPHLKAALMQSQDWRWGPDEPMTKDKLCLLLQEKIKTVNWRLAAQDVEPLLRPIDREMLNGWNSPLFISYVDKLSTYLKGETRLTIIFRIADGPAPRIDDRLFSGAITEVDDDEIARINTSGTFWCQRFDRIDSLEDQTTYSAVFMHLDQPGQPKQMAAKTHFGEMPMATYYPGNIYELPGWYIKDWNRRKLIHYRGIYRALYWFEPIENIPEDTLRSMQDYARRKP